VIVSSAQIDATGRYRYTLTRIWSEERPSILWIMLNPSTADATQDDSTIRRCVGFTRSWGYGGLMVANLFALRATDPVELSRCDDPVGPENDAVLCREAGRVPLVVAAWGTGGALRGRGDYVRELLACPLHHLGLTRQGFPRHPLYVRADSRPENWVAAP
jgi:hypothetical protein